MTSIKSIDHNFWINPPWGNGKEKYRLGLKPIEKSQWFKVNISDTLINHKKNLFESRYTDVIATTKDSIESQKILAKKLKVKPSDVENMENRFAGSDKPLKIIELTSCIPSEGKSLIKLK